MPGILFKSISITTGKMYSLFRFYVERIAKILRNQHIRVFYDYFETSGLWGKNLYQYLQAIYRDQAKYCVIFFIKNYLKKSWTRHELKQAQERAFSGWHLCKTLDKPLKEGGSASLQSAA